MNYSKYKQFGKITCERAAKIRGENAVNMRRKYFKMDIVEPSTLSRVDAHNA